MGKHGIKELQKTAVLGTAHTVRAVLMQEYKAFNMGNNRIKRDQLDATCFFISLFNAQHVSDVNKSILRSLRLIC
jgi:hypothetical protein